ncbi:MAG: hypothetical protein HSCHL_0634 [Hydrogenibacillus schlegelii]|uniref:DUF2249 domain-containing protein n=1 Tax=Hydrogenibacillus schlegelii TaxID=1484 RepID=A0A2T5G7V2_HYDSH|nr:DUF2249 domain-containing protein [Hydrogenibacillus schlegelii]PTQ52270.1 MAG: hypothetical protein HSCHL_0634 [Hydrogenibacillus schlegelii]
MEKVGAMANTIELDVRPYLRKKLEPFQLIMEHVARLEPDDVLLLHTTFKPTPLLGLMRAKGYHYSVQKKARDHWLIAFSRNKARVKSGTDGETTLAEAGEKAPIGGAETASEAETVKHPKGGLPTSGTAGAPSVIRLDNRGLEPPLPMMRTLAALERADPGDQIVIHNDRVPVFLLEELDQLGYPYRIEEQPDGSAVVIITKRPPAHP